MIIKNRNIITILLCLFGAGLVVVSSSAILAENHNSLPKAYPLSKETISDDNSKKQVYQCLKESVFKDYIDYRDLKLREDLQNLCAQTEAHYNQYLLSNENIPLSSGWSFTAFLVDSKTANNISSGLLCRKSDSSEYDIILLDFKDQSNVKATHIGLINTQSPRLVDKLVKYQQFDEKRIQQVANTFGIDLSAYLKASDSYSPPYKEAKLSLLNSALKDTLLTGGTIDSYENFDSHPAYFVNKDYSGGIILNSNENGMQYLHRFSIDQSKMGKNRFKITENKRELREPILLPDWNSL